MLREIRSGVAALMVTGALLTGAASIHPASAALTPVVLTALDNAVIDNPANAPQIAAEATANAIPPAGASEAALAEALADIRQIFRLVAERAIIEQDPTDPAPAAAVAEAVIAAYPAAGEVVASELEALIQTAAGGLLPAAGPGQQGLNINSPVTENQEAFLKSGIFTTRLGTVADLPIQSADVVSPTESVPTDDEPREQ